MKIFLTNPHKKKQHILVVFDIVIVFAVFIFAYVFRITMYEGGDISLLKGRLSWLILLAVLIHILSFFVFDLYNIGTKRSDINLFLLVTISVFFASGLIIIVSYIFIEHRLGRVLLLVHVPILVIVVFLWRKIFKIIFIKKRQQNNLLLIGSNSSKEKINSLLETYTMVDYKLISVISGFKENPGLMSTNGNVYSFDLVEFVKRNNIKTIVVGDKIKEIEILAEQLIDLKYRSIEIYDYPVFYKRLTAKVPILSIGDESIIFSSQDKIFNPYLYRNTKRILDMFLAVIGLLLSMPFFLIGVLAIKLSSNGPVFFVQERLGLNEKSFNIIKLRTMVVDAEKHTGPKWSSLSDPRITKVGKFLRKSRIDEIPQLINILKGEMSFVGPRPIRKYFADQLSKKFPYYRLRFAVKPGISGWAQVRGDYAGSEEGQLEKLEYELFYIQNQSLFLDLFIIIKTIQTVIFRHGQ